MDVLGKRGRDFPVWKGDGFGIDREGDEGG
jgi:hypothetical protein